MKLKLDDKGNAVLADLNGTKVPVYVHADGQEAPFDAAGAVTAINSRKEQAARIEAEMSELKGKLKLFDGIEDPATARRALATLKNLDDKKLVDAGQVDKVKQEVADAFRAQIEESKAAFQARVDELEASNKSLTRNLYDEIVGGAFAKSKVIADKFAIPADLVQARFGHHFGVEKGALFAVDGQGNRLYSRVKPQDLAGFDEALMILVDGYAHKNSILKGFGASGGGAVPNGGIGGDSFGGKRQVLRSQLDAMDPVQRAQVASSKDVVVVDG